MLALAGTREVLVKVIGEAAQEVDDPELLNVPVEGVDVYVTNKAVDGKTLAELAQLPERARRLPAQDHAGRDATSIPILPNTKIHRGDILTLVGRTQDTAAADQDCWASPTGRPTSPTSRSSAARITLGALIGALVWKVSGVPLTPVDRGRRAASPGWFSAGCARSVRPSAASRPPTVWLMNTVGLNMFIAIVGIIAGPGFVTGLQSRASACSSGGSSPRRCR